MTQSYAPTSSLRFLARLAPASREAAPSVRAALPSRFAPGEGAEPLTEQLVETPAQGSRAAPQEVSVATPSAKSRALAAEPAAPRAAPKPVSMQGMAWLDPQGLRAASAEAPSLQAAGMPRGNPTGPAPAQPGPLSRAAQAVATQREPQAPPQRSEPDSAPKAAADPWADHSRPATDMRPPLRESTVAQRAHSRRAETPRVVQVTIDRVDVRVPPPPLLERRSNPRSRNAPTVSLSEYLRQRSRSGGVT